jgi:hypothetical protein
VSLPPWVDPILSARVLATKARERAAGRFLGGHAPYGWRWSHAEGGLVEQNVGEQDAIRRILRLRRAGLTLRQIRDAMAARGTSVSHECVRQVLPAHGGPRAVNRGRGTRFGSVRTNLGPFDPSHGRRTLVGIAFRSWNSFVCRPTGVSWPLRWWAC